MQSRELDNRHKEALQSNERLIQEAADKAQLYVTRISSLEVEVASVRSDNTALAESSGEAAQQAQRYTSRISALELEIAAIRSDNAELSKSLQLAHSQFEVFVHEKVMMLWLTIHNLDAHLPFFLPV